MLFSKETASVLIKHSVYRWFANQIKLQTTGKLSKTMRVFDNGVCCTSLLISYFLPSIRLPVRSVVSCRFTILLNRSDTLSAKFPRLISLRRSLSIFVGAEELARTRRKLLEIGNKLRNKYQETQNAQCRTVCYACDSRHSERECERTKTVVFVSFPNNF